MSFEQIPMDIEGDFPFDGEVLKFMPKGTKVVSAEAYGRSVFTRTGRVSVIMPEGKRGDYFLKLALDETGQVMLFGEYTSLRTMDALIPGLVPTPLGWGKYSTEPVQYSLLSSFLNMNIKDPPNPKKFAARIAELHQKGTSPNGDFGFPVTTYNGALAHTVSWEKDWAVFFTTMLKAGLGYDTQTNGTWPELEMVAQVIIDKVIPRLLRPLQSESNQIRPSLLHGDLWSGNVGTDIETGEIVLFDVGSYYAHNELELGSWRCPWSQHPERAQVYMKHYLEDYPPAEPVEEFDDRNRLHSLKFNLGYSGGHKGSTVRQTLYTDMCYLCKKYTDGTPPEKPT